MTADVKPAPGRPSEKAPPGGRGPRRVRRAPVVLGSVAAVLALLIVVLSFLNWNLLRGPIAHFASAATGRRVEIAGDLKVHLLTLTPTVEVNGLSVGDPAWQGRGDLARIRRLVISVRLLPLLTGRVVLPLLEVDQPVVDLLRDARGRENWRLGSGAPSPHPLRIPPIERFVVTDGQLRYADVRKRLFLSGEVQSNERTSGPESHAFSLTGSGTINRDRFQIRVAGGPLLHVDLSRPYPFSADIRAGRTHVLVSGALNKPFDTALMQARLSVEGADLANLYDLTGLALPNTPPYAFSGTLHRDDTVYTFDGASGRFGGSDLEGRIKVVVDPGKPIDLSADLSSRTLDIKDLATLLGAKPVTPGVHAASASPGTGLLLPDAPLETQRLKGMNAQLRYRAGRVNSGFLPIRAASLDLTLKNGVLSLAPVSFSFPAGSVVGDITINANLTPPLTRADVRFNRLNLDELVPAKRPNPPIEGVLAARLKLEGRGASVHRAAAAANGAVSLVVPSGRMRQAFAELLGVNAGKGLSLLLSKNKGDTGIRCGLADFSVRSGVMRAQTALLDTDVVKVTGSGSVNLADERVDLTFKGDTKRFRIGHVFLPIVLQGTLAHPEIGVKPGPAIAQGAAAVAMGAVLTPLAAILPFIDPGLAKNADCSALLTEARAGPAPVGPAQGARPAARAAGH